MIGFQELRDKVTDERIVEILKNYGVEDYVDTDKYFIFPTICHNLEAKEASMKLYYYKENHMFHCYTECGDSFDIFDLLKKIHKLRGYEIPYREVINEVLEGQEFNSETSAYASIIERYAEEEPFELKTYNKGIMNIFCDYLPIEWEVEGITEETMKKFGVKYSPVRNKIIIPHFDINGELVGIRGRALNPEEVAEGKKYMPLTIEGTTYRYPVSYNLYGLNITKDAVAKMKKII